MLIYRAFSCQFARLVYTLVDFSQLRKVVPLSVGHRLDWAELLTNIDLNFLWQTFFIDLLFNANKRLKNCHSISRKLILEKLLLNKEVNRYCDESQTFYYKCKIS